MMPKDPHVPKKTKAAKKGASAALKSDGHASDPDTDSDSSDDELTIEDEAPEMTPAVLMVLAPTDERGKALYDAVSAVWSPRNKSAPAEKIRSGIAGFGDTVRGLRDSWKLKNDNLRKAELPNSPTAGDASRLKEEAARYRSAMEVVMARSLTFGHPAVIKRYVHDPIPFQNTEGKRRHDHFYLRRYINIWSPSKPLHFLQSGFWNDILNVVMSSEQDVFVHCHNEYIHSCMSIDHVQLFASRDIRKMPVTLHRGENLSAINSLKSLLIIFSRLGENQFTMSALYSFMLDRFNAGDYDSSLVSNILKVRFNHVPELTAYG
jgi:hypothetical protein